MLENMLRISWENQSRRLSIKAGGTAAELQLKMTLPWAALPSFRGISDLKWTYALFSVVYIYTVLIY